MGSTARNSRTELVLFGPGLDLFRGREAGWRRVGRRVTISPMPRWPERKDAAKTARRLERARDAIDQEELRELMGRRFKEARLELGLSQAELAEALGRSQNWCSEVEAGRTFPPRWAVLAMAKVSGRSVGWFHGEG